MTQHGRVTVFGGSGFVGRYLVSRLAAAGAVVTIASRRPERGKFLQSAGNVGQITHGAADINDEAAVRAVTRGADAVVNLVGILYERGRQRFQSVHVDGAGLVARVAAQEGVRAFVHMSALAADAGSPSKYARSKAAGEAAVRAALPKAVIFRPSIIVGWEDDFFNRFAGMARLSPWLPLIGGGGNKMQPIFVGDIANAFMAALANDQAAGRTYGLGGPRVYTFTELMELLLAEIGRRRVLVRVPFTLASAMAMVLGLAPTPVLTRDQVRLLARDDIVVPGAVDGTIDDLGIKPAAIEAVIPAYLARYRPADRARST
ncbi:MAG: complex I NDUFA9 subunit family protein [Alphaproteobacteria bacterium]|nr:complex I NDUFA9 subunit family protein [Alphaproteobacteria bacterium]